MGNCYYCTREPNQALENNSIRAFDQIKNSKATDNLYSKYTRITIDQIFQESQEDINYLSQIEPQELLNFQLHMFNMRILNSSLKEDIQISVGLGEDILMKKARRKSKVRHSILYQGDASDFLMGQTKKIMNNKYPDLNKSQNLDENNTNQYCENILFETSQITIDQKGQTNIDLDFESYYEIQFDQIWDTCFIMKLKLANSKEILSIVMIDMLLLAVGPRHFDLEFKDLKTGKPLGRILFDLCVRQVKLLEVSLNDVSCKLNGKCDYPLFSQFKCIHNTDIPEMSEATQTRSGKYKKDKNLTHFKWKNSDSLFDTPTIRHMQKENLSRKLEAVIANKKTQEIDDEQLVDDMLLDDAPKINLRLDNNITQMVEKKNKGSMLSHSRNRFKSMTVNKQTMGQIQNLLQKDNRNSHNLESQNENLDDLIMSASFLKRSNSTKSNRSEGSSTLIIKDAKQYYRNYDQNDVSPHIESDLIGECYVGFSKLLQTEYRQFEKKEAFILSKKMSFNYNQNLSQSMVQKGSNQTNKFKLELQQDLSSKNALNKMKTERKNYEEKLWSMGKIVGSIKGNFRISNLPVIQQMALGILTENGIVMNQIPILLKQEEGNLLRLLKKGKKNEKICSLIDLTQRLQKIDCLKPKSRSAGYKQTNERERVLAEIQQLFKDKEKHIGHIFKYFDELDIIRGQQALIDLAFHCLLYAENVKYEFKKDYYDILQTIMNRGEFKLNHLALSKEIHVKIELTQDCKNKEELSTLETIRQEKIRVAQFYNKLLYQTLDDALNKFYRKDVEPFMKSYLENIISICFFRVPKFQKIFLECFEHSEDIQISEWKGMNWDLNNDLNQQKDKGFVKLFNWNKHFFNHIPQSNEVDDANRSLSRVEGNRKWQSRLQKRSIAFFQIIKNLSELIGKTVNTYSLYFQDIPGYRIILKAVLIEMKQRKITEYPDSLIDATMTLIHNTQLLNVFLQIVFLKTNAYDSETLQSTLLLVQKWLNHIERKHIPFPSNFDFAFFFKGLLISLEIDHSMTIPKTLYLLYKTLHYYPIDQRCVIVHDLIDKFFYRLFFNWSYTVREVLVSFLLYQVEYALFHRTTNFLGTLSNSGQDSGRTKKTFQDFQQQMSKSSQLTMKEQVKLGRKKSMRKVKECIRQFEVIIYSNPNDPTNLFNRQSQLQSINLVTGLEMSLKHNRSTQDTNQYLNKLRKDSDNMDLEQPKLINQHISTTSYRKQNDNQNLIGKAQTLRSFVNAFKIFKEKMKEIEILDDYYSKGKSQNVQSFPRLTQDALRINESSFISQQSISESQLNQDDLNSQISPDLQKKYSKIIEKIPQELRVYSKQAVADFYKYTEQYEKWRQSLHFQSHMSHNNEFINSIPDFNMEKSMPVEDDENLEKPEEW
eukprot:403362980